jgi:hypothetical protein
MFRGRTTPNFPRSKEEPGLHSSTAFHEIKKTMFQVLKIFLQSTLEIPKV